MLISELYAEVAIRVQDVSPALVQTACRRALVKFFRDSTCWRQRFSTTALQIDKAEYDLTGFLGDPVCAVTDLKTKLNQHPVISTIESKMNLVSRTWRLEKGSQPLRFVSPVEPGIVRLWPIPDVAVDFLDVELAFYPGADTTDIPESFGRLYFDDLVDGACGVLYRLPRRVWTDLKAANDCDETLLRATMSAKGRISKSNTTGITIARTTGFEEL